MDAEEIRAQLEAARKSFAHRLSESACECPACIGALNELSGNYYAFAGAVLTLIGSMNSAIGSAVDATSLTAPALMRITKRLDALDGGGGALSNEEIIALRAQLPALLRIAERAKAEGGQDSL